MIISRKRLNHLIDEAVDKAREEMYTNERFNDIYRRMDDENHMMRQELDSLHRELANLAGAVAILNPNSKNRK